MSQRTRRPSDQENLINMTETSEYVSELQKRNKPKDLEPTPEETAKSKYVKIGLLALLAVMMIIGLILIIVDLANRNNNKIENVQEYNMFSVNGTVVKTLNTMKIPLMSKLKNPQNKNADEPRCVDTSTVKICEDAKNKFVDELIVDITSISPGVSRTKFVDKNNPKRWDLNGVDGFMKSPNPDALTMLESLGFEQTNSDNFEFIFTDPVSQNTVFDTTKRSLIFTDKYIEIGITLPTQVLFGLGQHNAKFLLNEGLWTMFNRDQPGSPAAIGQGSENLYGTHPFLMGKTADNKFFGILFYNSNAQQVKIRFSSSGKSIINYITVGGVLDVYYFMPDSADEIIRKYNRLVGLPTLPPFWALGFQQSAWPYNSLQTLKDVVNNYTTNGYMFDVIWADIHYMDRYIDFTVDDVNYKGLGDWVNELHQKSMRFVPIIDAGISLNKSNAGDNWYEIGKEMNLFVKTTKNPSKKDGNLIATVWPGFTAFVDFFHAQAYEFWKQGLDKLYSLVQFDGIWLDMNEPANFCNEGECYPPAAPYLYDELNKQENVCVSDSPVKPGEFENLQYTPGGGQLYNKTISMDAYFTDKDGNGTFVMYNVHNLYGTLETMATQKYLQSKFTNRTFVLSRDSFVGHGQYGTIWTGDNDSTFEHLKLSQSSLMTMSMMGLPFVGADICGFSLNTTSVLCARWAQLGAFYPFMRNHFAEGKNPQEFYRFEEKYQIGMKESMKQRYSLLRYLYTCLWKASTKGDTVMRHPMYDWPNLDELSLGNNTFMFGPSIRVSMNYDESENPADFDVSFPKGIWLEYYTYNLKQVQKDVEKIKVYGGFNHTNIHIKGGSIVPIQDVGDNSGVTNTVGLLSEPMKLLIVPSETSFAQGNLYIARGETIKEYYQYFTITHFKNSIQIRFEEGTITEGGGEINEVIDEIHIASNNQTILDSDFACAVGKDKSIKQMKVEAAQHPISGNKFLKISGDIHTIQFDETNNIFYGKSGRDYNYCDKGYTARVITNSTTHKTFRLFRTNGEPNSNDLNLNIILLKHNIIQVKINDNLNSRFKVPNSVLSEDFEDLMKQPNDEATLDDFIKYSDDGTPFFLKIHEFQAPNSEYFRIDPNSLIMKDYFLSLDTVISTTGKLYGLGERVGDFFLKEGIYTTWARDIPDPVDDGKPPGKNIYGSHPIYFTQSNGGNKYHWAMLNLNANAQDTKISFTGDLGGQISHYISGEGIFDMYFIIEKKTPEDVVKAYHSLIGPTLLPPMWGLGWHQCKYGYKSTDALKTVYQKYQEGNFPMDVLWSDIDHMDRYRDFTFDKDGNFKGLDSFVRDTLHKNNRRYVPIVDAGIAIVRDGSYSAFDEGLKNDVFIKSGNSKRRDNDPLGLKGILYGRVWPGYSAFPDFTKNEATQWWIKSLNSYYKALPFDGLWLDMNEASNFGVGAMIPEDVVDPSESVKSKLIYSPGSRDIETQSLSVDGVHSDEYSEINYHSLFGFLQGIATYKFYTYGNLKPFIISRSTFVGQGKYTSHWNGDNFSQWPYLVNSVNGIYNMNLYGINFNGADICGFIGKTTENLCQVWTNLGAFYPFARNHNEINDEIGQEPYVWSEPTQRSMRHALRWRYALIRYFYTELYKTSVDGGMFWKPLFFEFPTEQLAYQNLEMNIMIGSAIKLSPLLKQGEVKTDVFTFPPGTWCNIINYSYITTTQTVNTPLPTDPMTLNLHLRMGYIIPLQRDAETKNVNTTVDLMNMPTGLMINVDTNTKAASGTFYADNGVTLGSDNSVLTNLDFVYDDANKKAYINFIHELSTYRDSSTAVGLIEIVNASKIGSLKTMLKIQVDGVDSASGSYDSTTDVLSFKPENADFGKTTQIEIMAP